MGIKFESVLGLLVLGTGLLFMVLLVADMVTGKY